MFRFKISFLLILSAALLIVTACLGAQERTVMVYNSFAGLPFVDGTGGLAKDFVDYLNRDEKGEYRFVLQNISPDSLVETKLSNGASFDGIALFQNPAWVARHTGLVWSSGVFSDSQVLVFRTTSQPATLNAQSITGLRFAAVRGKAYPGLDALVEGNQLNRIDTDDDAGSLKLVLAGKADFAPMAASVFTAFSSQRQYGGSIAAGSLPGETSVYRRLAFGNDNAALAARIEISLTRMSLDASWASILRKYGISKRMGK